MDIEIVVFIPLLEITTRSSHCSCERNESFNTKMYGLEMYGLQLNIYD